MKTSTKLSLLTLLGLILPFGNIWGPYFLHVPIGSSDYTFRKKLVRVEMIVTVIAFIASIAINVKALKAGVNTDLLTVGVAVLTVWVALIILIAIVASIISMGKKEMTPANIIR